MNVLIDGEILLFGTVGEGFFEDGFTAMDVVTALAQIGRSKDVTVRINSGGGFATEGVAIFNALDSHRGEVSVVVESVASSAASIIAMAGKTVTMKTGAVMMVHDPAAITAGTSEDHAKSIEALETLAVSMAEIYAEKTGRKATAIREEMKAETWMTAKEAVAKGYADKTDKGRSKEPTAFDYRLYQHAPERMVAMAEARGWKHTAAVATKQEETSMTTESEKAAAEKQAAEKAAADAKTAAEKAEADKAAAEKTAAEKAATAETPAQIEARVRTELTEQNRQIAAACEIAGAPGKATEFIAAAKSVPQVLIELQAMRAEGKLPKSGGSPAGEISARHGPPTAATTASWDKQTERYNARIANGRTG